MEKSLLILDSGHNEKVAGKEAPDKSLREWEFNNDMQHKIKARCEQHGISVYLTNPKPQGIDEIGLSKRATLANDYWKAKGKPKAIMISLHANAYGGEFNGARGTETYIANNAGSSSNAFSRDLNNEIVSVFKKLDPQAKDRGVKTEDFTVIYKSQMPTCLVEYGFYSNKDDLKILKNNRSELVEGTVRAICKYFNINYQAPAQFVEKPSIENNQKWAVCVGAYSSHDSAVKMKNELISKGYKDTYLIPR